jgi:hypothetical protein
VKLHIEDEGKYTYLTAAHDTLVLVVAEGTFVADSYESGGTNVGVAHWAFAVAFVAEAADGDTCLLAAHYEIAARISMKIMCIMKKALTDDGETCWRL